VLVGVGLGLVTPLLAALVPILRAARRTVREAIDDRGGAALVVSSNPLVRLLTGIRVPDAAVTLAIRNSVRRRARLVTTATMLALAGAMFIASLDLKSAWERNVDEARQDRHFQFEMRLTGGYPAAEVLAAVRSVPGVATVESWAATSATRGGAADLEISRVYPDGGHGGVTLRAASPATTLIAHRMLAGRWLSAADTNAVVLNSLAAASVFSDLRVGDTVTMRVDHRPIRLRVVGLMREPLTPATMFLTPAWFGAVTGHGDTTSGVRVQARDAAASETVARDVQRALERAGMGVRVIITEQRLASAQGGHVYILVYALGFIATLMAVVGLIGLASSLGVSVLERTREFGIMRALGGTRAMIMRTVIVEGVAIAVLSVGVAVVLSRAISTIVGRVLASIASQELVLRLSFPGVLLWIAGLLVGTLLVSALPAARAARLTARDALSHI
jgi:putative ABC transport system permease protein